MESTILFVFAAGDLHTSRYFGRGTCLLHFDVDSIEECQAMCQVFSRCQGKCLWERFVPLPTIESLLMSLLLQYLLLSLPKFVMCNTISNFFPPSIAAYTFIETNKVCFLKGAHGWRSVAKDGLTSGTCTTPTSIDLV